MRMPPTKPLAAALGFALAAGLAAPASADEVADFYRGKTVTIVAPVSAGGLYGNFAQILSNHLGDHIPGQPTVIVQHMPGAGGVVAANHVYTVAPKDGTTLMTPLSGVVTTPLLRPGAVRYQPGELTYLGGWGEIVLTMTVFETSPAKTVAEAREHEVIAGAIGTGTSNYQLPHLMNQMLGTRFRLVTGYGGGAEIRLAMERGEVHGFAGAWLSWVTAKPEWIRDGRIHHLAQFGAKRAPDLPEVPTLLEFAENDEQRAVFGFIADAGMTAYTLAAPPGLPEARSAALAKAYAATLRDPAFLAAAEKQNYPIAPLSREAVSAAVKRMIDTPPEIVAATRKAMGFD